MKGYWKYEVTITASNGSKDKKEYPTKAKAYADIRRLLSECDGMFIRCDLRKLTDNYVSEWYDMDSWEEARITRA